MKALPFSLILLAAACGKPDAADQARSGGSPAADDLVDCATGGSDNFEHVCTVESQSSPSGRIVTLRAPDGGFRRLLVRSGEGSIVAADGAEPARVGSPSNGVVDVSIGADRYKVPLKVVQ